MLCAGILKYAGAKQTNADLIQDAEELKEKIQNMRSFVNEKIFKDTHKNLLLNQEQEKINQIKNLQNKITQDYTQIMADLSHYCEEVMDKAPCKFAVIGMGSLARKEITPYSDFEHSYHCFGRTISTRNANKKCSQLFQMVFCHISNCCAKPSRNHTSKRFDLLVKQ